MRRPNVSCFFLIIALCVIIISNMPWFGCVPTIETTAAAAFIDDIFRGGYFELYDSAPTLSWETPKEKDTIIPIPFYLPQYEPLRMLV